MAEGQKPVRNTLLSGAAGNNFFEDAALLVPVPMVSAQSQEPAIAEIDLNSEEPSSNRSSIEKEMEQINLNDSPVDEPAAPISLFSRAATGIDAFSRLLNRDSSTSCSTASTSTSGGSNEPAVVTLLPPKSKQPPSNVSPEPAVVTLLPVQGAREAPKAVTLFAVPSVPEPEPSKPTIQPVSPWPPIQGTLASTVYMNPGGFPNSSQTPSALSFSSTGGMTQSEMLSSNYVILGPNDISMGGSLENASNVPPTVPLISKPAVNMENTPYNFPKSPLDSAAPIRPPSNIAGNSNSFRMGSQRPKYAEYPEFQDAPIVAPIKPPVQAPAPVYDPNNISAILNPGPFYAPVPNFASATPSEVSNSSLYFSSPPSSARNNTPPPLTPPMLTHNSYVRPPMSMVHPTNYYSAAGIQQFGPMELPPLTYHWFHGKEIDGKVVWKPFSIIDSVALEDALANDPDRLVPTDGGRYDVSVSKKLRCSVYWEETPVDVRRGSWFYKGPMDNKFIPYDEEFALKLEKEYADCMRTGTWQKRLEFPGGESVILHSTSVVVHFCQAAAPDDWGNLPESQIRPRVVKRGIDEIEVEDGESTQIDHLVFVVHGIGPICDFKLRNIIEAVDDFRGLSIQLIHSHFRESIEKSLVGRTEFLPVSWHKSLHGDKGIDEQLKRITLRSIPKFRDFTNDTLLDILFYTSPVYCQTVIDSVSSELNRLHKLFLSRNPTFKGKVSLTGHSLGSLILFDLLVHQPTIDVNNGTENVLAVQGKTVDLCAQAQETDGPVSSSSSRTVSYTVGTAGTGQPFISYPILDFSPAAFFALGSPIAMFVTVRGIEKLGDDFHFPTCPSFFNIFHPYDPVAYRIETLIDPTFQSRPVLIPHHKGRKRIHLELKETMARVGADIKQRVMDAVKNTWNTVYQYTGLTKSHENLETEIQTAIADEFDKKSEPEGIEDANETIPIGSLNGGRRIDHVLQEAPYETFNEYVFAMSTHVGYWESEDTMLLILTEIYNDMGIQCDRVISATPGVASTSPTHHGQAHSTNGNVPYQGSTRMAAAFPNSYQPSAPYLESNTMIHAAEQYPQPAPGNLAYTSPATHPQPLIPLIPQDTQPIPMLTQAIQTSDIFSAPTSSMYQAPSQRPSVIGNRPVVDPTQFPRGMDPTAPMPITANVVPPPKMGFVPKQN